MKVSDIVNGLKDLKEQDKVDLLLIHCDLFYEMEFSSINMGLVYVATYAESQGFRAYILTTPQMFGMDKMSLRRFIRKKKPTIVGFYVISDNFEQVRDLAQDIREWLPDAKIVLGGPLAAALGGKLLENPSFDMIVTGEGEYAISAICNAIILGKGSIADAPGIIYRDDGNVVEGKPAETISDLDSLPFPDQKYLKGQVFQVVSGRGCPYKCAFCFQAGHGLKFRVRSAENVVTEILNTLESREMIGFDFIDDAFIINPKRCLEIAKRLENYRLEKGRDFIFFCQGRANILDNNPDLIPALARAGLARMQLGIESGDPDILQLYQKQITVEQVKRVIRNIRDNGGFMTVGGFILGGPFESEDTFRRTLNLAMELIDEAPGIFETSAGFLGAYPGTEIAKDPSRFGLKIIEPDFITGWSLGDVQLVSDTMDRKALRQLEVRFRESVVSAMERNLYRIPPSILRKHYLWAEKYKIFSLWYMLFLNKMRVIRNYFKFLESPKFRPLAKIPLQEIGRWKPMRLQEKRQYDNSGNIILPYSIYKKNDGGTSDSSGSNKLCNPDEILVYELSSGKISVWEAVSRFCAIRGKVGEENEVLYNLFIPLYKRLEESYNIIFFE